VSPGDVPAGQRVHAPLRGDGPWPTSSPRTSSRTLQRISPIDQFDGEAVGLITGGLQPLPDAWPSSSATPRLTRTLSRWRATGDVVPTTWPTWSSRRMPASSSSTSPPRAARRAATDTLNGTVNFGLVTPSAYSGAAGRPAADARRRCQPATRTRRSGHPTFVSSGYDITAYSLKGIVRPQGDARPRSSPAGGRERQGVASSAWRTTRRPTTSCPLPGHRRSGHARPSDATLYETLDKEYFTTPSAFQLLLRLRRARAEARTCIELDAKAASNARRAARPRRRLAASSVALACTCSPRRHHL